MREFDDDAAYAASGIHAHAIHDTISLLPA